VLHTAAFLLNAMCIRLRNLRCARAAIIQLAAAILLLNAGAPLEAGDCKLRTPLHRAAAEGHRAVVAELLRRGATVDSRDR
jgi:ankyrin repeat protein